MTTKKPLTIKERRARYRAKGRNVSTVITDEKALEKLDALIDSRGGVKPAIEYALRRAPAKAVED